MTFAPRAFLHSACIFLALALSAQGAAVNATWNTATDVPVSASSYTATGSTVNFTLNFAPPTGTNLTVVNNTGLPFISGTFDNLAQGQVVNLSYNGITYLFVASYFGGTGNDLVLVWAGNRLVAWGANFGSLGNNDLSASSIPVAVTTPGTPLAGHTLLALDSGGGYSLGLCSNGTLASWGANDSGQLGNNTTTTSIVPVAVVTAGTPLAGKYVVAISTGGNHSLALCSDGTLAGWGSNTAGRLGNTAINYYTLVPVAVTTAGTPLAGKSVVAIGTGNAHSLALCSDGTLTAWGDSTYGQLGNNTTTYSRVPVSVVTAGKSVVSIAAGGYHNIALYADGTLVTWGQNTSGQLGNNTTTNSSVPVAVTTAGTVLAGKTVIAVAAGNSHSLALCSDGTLAAWGLNGYGQLGNNSTSNSSIPVAVSTSGVLAGKTVVGVSAGSSHSLASCSDGTVVAWGYNIYGQLGNNSVTNSSSPVVVSTSTLASGESFVRVSAGPCASHTLGLVATPLPAATTTAATSVGTTTAVLNGTVNANGGTTTVSFDYGLDSTYGTNVAGTPASVTGSGPTAVSTTLTGLKPNTNYHFRVNCANGSATSDDAGLTFTTLNGNLSALALSAGTLSPAFSPTVYSCHAAVGAAVSSIAVTPTTSDNQAAVAVNGTTVVSGSASSPIPLGYGDNTINIVVTAADHLSTVTYVLIVTRAAPSQLTASYSSGAEVPITSNGFLAMGNTVNLTLNYAPVPGTTLVVVNNTGLPFISGTFDNLAQGQVVNLGYNGANYQFVATYYGGTGNDLVLVWAGSRPVAWGINGSGELGNNSTNNSSVPVAVTTAGTPLARRMLLALAAGQYHSLALCSDGTLASWGNNYYGELGNNTTTTQLVPAAVTTAGTPLAGKVVVAVAAGSQHSLVLCADGSMAGWGYNGYGQLGNSTSTSSSVPVAVTTAGTPLAGRSVVAIATGYSHSLALCSDGTLAAWGNNNQGQLGNNSSTNSNMAVAVTAAGTPLAGKTVVSMAAGGGHNIALCSDGTLVTWGQNINGQLGNNSTNGSYVPVAVTTAGTPLNGKTVVAVAAGASYSMALCSDGTVAAWGYNNDGEMGNNTTSYASLLPVAVSTSGVLAGKTVVGLATGGYHSMARCADGTLVAWGLNDQGQLGNNSTTNSSVPAAVSTSTLAPGESFMQAASSSSASYNLGLVATPFPAVTTVAATSVGTTTVVLNGTVNANGGTIPVSFDYGLNSSYGTNVAGTPATVTGSGDTAVSTTLTGLLPNTTYHFRVNGSSGSVTCNGADLTFTTLNETLSGLVLSAGTLSPAFSPTTYSYHAFVDSSVSTLAVTPTTADSHATVTVNGMAVVSGSASSPVPLVYGDNAVNVVVTAKDNGTTITYALNVTRVVPAVWTVAYTSVADVPVTFNDVTLTGGTVNFALNFEPMPGTVLTVVNNIGAGFIRGAFGNLAQGQVVGLSYNRVTYNFVASYNGGTGNDLVLVWAGTRPVAWGYNVYGQLGNENGTNSSVPVAVAVSGTPLASRPLQALCMGSDYSLALCLDGSLASWGGNVYGDLGINSNTASFVPVAVTTAGTPLAGRVVAAVSAGYKHSLALCSDGTLAAWGSNFNGELGSNAGNYAGGYSTIPAAVTTAGTALAGKSVVAIGAGDAHSLALCSNGTLATWGDNTYGQLGNNTTTSSSSLAVAVTAAGTPLAGRTVVTLAAGGSHNIALCADGTLVTWGKNDSGQLGNNSTTNSLVPVAVTTAGTVLAGKTVIAVAAGNSHSLALCSDGTLAAWGQNSSGQLGNNSTTQSTVPVAVNTSGVLVGKTVVGVSAGSSHSLAWCTDGTAVAWGNNIYGQLGNNSTTNSSLPVAVSTSSLTAGERFMQLGSGSFSLHSLGLVATPVPAATTLAATAVGTTTVVLNGTVNANGGTAAVSFAYGLDSSYGTNVAGTPASVTGSSDTTVSTTLTGLIPNTTYHFCVSGAKSSGTVNGADLTFTTQDGNLAGLALSAGTLSPAFTPKVYSYHAAVATDVSSIAVTPTTSDSQATVAVSGTPVVSGSASSPIPLGYGDNTIHIVTTAADNVSTVTYALIVTRAVPASLSAAYSSAADVPVNINGYTAAGSTVHFSLNYAPMPGTVLTVVNNTGLPFISGTFDNLAQGQTVNLSYNGMTYPFVASYFGGTGNDLVLVWGASRLAAWGWNGDGQLGNSTTTNSTTPVAVTTAGTPLEGRTLLALATGYRHSLALFADGSLASWGYNYYGQLGNNSATSSSLPVAVTTAGTTLAGKVVVAVAAGSWHNLALCADGTLAAWGINYYGELGNNSSGGSSSVPVAVTTAGTPLAGKSVVSIAAGYLHSLALCSDGTLAAWGLNSNGVLGSSTTAISSSVSVAVAVTTAGTPLAGKSVVAIAAGEYHNIALCADGALMTWGQNTFGQLGNNKYTDSNVPVAVTTQGTVLDGKTVIAVAAGASHCLVLCSDGTLAAWSYNAEGQLGNNSTTNSSIPVAVSTSGVLAGKTVVGVTAGFYHNLAHCSDGTLATWGYNSNGQLGTNSTTNSSIPVAVSTATFAAPQGFMLASAGSEAFHSLGLAALPVPAATTLTATAAGTTTVVLNGTVNAHGGSATVSFDYGLDSSYGTHVVGTPVTGFSDTAVSTTLTGLAQKTTYHFRVNASIGALSYNGADMTFTTLDGNLSGLALGAGALSPSFSPAVYTYHAAVGTDVGSIAITPTTSDSSATVAVSGTPVVSGNASSPVPLAYGDNTINIVVTASDHISTVAYALVVTRTVPASWTAAYSSAADIPLTIYGFNPTGGTVDFALNYAPVPGTTLTVVNNTGLGFINGTFDNLAQGQTVNLSYNGTTYPFVASYYGGTGNDLVLVWAGNRPVSWGNNYSGQLGNGTTTGSSTPVAVTTAGTPLAGRTLMAYAAGFQHSLGVCADGSLVSWGANNAGQLGNNTTTNSSVPLVVPTAGTPLEGRAVVAVSAGFFNSMALCSDGTVATWGADAYTSSPTPVAVPTAGTPLEVRSVVAIATSGYHYVALCSDGTLAAWGFNGDGELGNGTTTDSSVPVAVTTAGTPLDGKTVVAMAVGAAHNLALCADGTLVAWGYNFNGQLGNGTTTSSSVPVAVTTAGTALAGKTVVAVAAGGSHSLALCSDGTVAAWGSNSNGELGNNDTFDSSLPVAVVSNGVLAGKTVTGLKAGGSHNLVRCADGTLAAWGANDSGQLGNNSTTSSGIPVAVGASSLAPAESFALVASGPHATHTLALVGSPIPATTTLAATSITATTVVLNGTVNANDGTAAVSFDYGLDSSYGANVAGAPAFATGSSDTAVSTTLSGLTPNTTYHFRANGGISNGSDMTFTTLSLLQGWRQLFFGTTASSGTLADDADYDDDGIPNLLEYALNLSPTTASRLPVTTAVNGANYEYTYSRSTTAVNAGTAYAVEWSGALPGTWSRSGVTQTVLSDDGTTQQVKAVIPVNAAATMFMRLSVTAPP